MIRKVITYKDATENHRFNIFEVRWFLFGEILIWTKLIEVGISGTEYNLTFTL